MLFTDAVSLRVVVMGHRDPFWVIRPVTVATGTSTLRVCAPGLIVTVRSTR